jgi:coenzyme F420-reducing hydrogenase delta subunit
MSKSEANIVVFACNWDGLSSIEAAAQARLSYPASVKVIRVSCLSRLHQGLVLKAFELGADGVMLLGCEPGKCQFDTDGGLIAQECDRARKLMGLLGLREERLVLAHVPRGDGSDFVGRVTRFIAEIGQMRPAVADGA